MSMATEQEEDLIYDAVALSVVRLLGCLNNCIENGLYVEELVFSSDAIKSIPDVFSFMEGLSDTEVQNIVYSLGTERRSCYSVTDDVVDALVKEAVDILDRIPVREFNDEFFYHRVILRKGRSVL